MIWKSLLLMLALGLTSCYPLNITMRKYHTLPQVANGETFTIKSRRNSNAIQSSLIQRKLIRGLEKHGWKYSSSGSPHYTVAIDYGSSDGRVVFDPTSSSASHHFDTIHGFSGASGADSYGVVGAVPTDEVTHTVFLDVKINTRSGAQVLNANLSTLSYSSNITDYMPAMIDTLLYDFPGTSGYTEDYGMDYGSWDD